jgi:hypothetical protein
MYNRAAQFAPFAALTGYDEAVKEMARLTNSKIDIDEGLRSILNNKLNIINDHLKENLQITFTYFIPDKRKNGGEYSYYTGIVRRIDKDNKTIYMLDKSKLLFNDILNITSDSLKLENE